MFTQLQSFPQHFSKPARVAWRFLSQLSTGIQFTVLSVLLATATLASLHLIDTASISPASTTRTQTGAILASDASQVVLGKPEVANIPAAIPASHASRTLLNKPELVQLRSAYARHYDLGNGKRVAVVGTVPLNYQDAEGNWQPIQPVFTRAENGWRVYDNNLRSTFAGDSTAVQLESNGQMFGWQPLALEINDDGGDAHQLAVPTPGDAVQAQAAGRTLRYASAWSDATLLEQFHSSAGTLEQELVLAQAPAAAAEGEWLSLRADLALPTGVRIIANGQEQTGEFTTLGAVQFQQADGTPLLALIPPRAYEQDNRSAFVGGRYRVVPHVDSVTLWVQTPLAWWLAAERTYPAVLDPTMQVKQVIEAATIQNLADNPSSDPAEVLQRACVGIYGIPDINDPFNDIQTYRRGYLKFKLPSLPDGASPTGATLVAVPETTGVFNYGPGAILVHRDTFVHRVTSDWNYLLGTSQVPAGVFPNQLPSSNAQEIPWIFLNPAALDQSALPATTWNVTGDVQAWYAAPGTNFGFSLVFEDDTDDYSFWSPLDHCFPTTAGWSNLDSVVDNPSNPTTDGPGLGLLIEYTSPELANNEIREVTVPSNQPGKNTYRRQYHEYALPYAYGWQLVGARGSLNSVHDSIIPNTPVDLTDSSPSGSYSLSGNPIGSDAGKSHPDNEVFATYQPNYVLVNSYHRGALEPLANRVRVQPDNAADDLDDDNKKYHIQIADARERVSLQVGISTTIPIDMDNGFLVGQELNFPLSTTIEIKIPYPAGYQSYYFNVQLFAPTFKHGSRVQNGMQVTPGPDAWEIEFQVKPEHIGKWFDTWLLAVVWDNEFPGPVPNLEATIVACQNREDVVLYPLDGECVELRKPPSPIPTEQLYAPVGGNVRIFSPAGFSGNCAVSCTTEDTLPDGTRVAAYIGYEGDDDRWVALKGGQFNISGSSITTTSDVRLIMVDYSQDGPITLPVLRGDFQVNATSGRMTPTSAPADTYLLVGSPLHAQDDSSGWSYKIELAQDRMIASGALQRIIEPTAGDPTTFGFNADWSITARGGVDLQGGASVQSISQNQFSVGTLLLTPPMGADYTMEHNPLNADATLPAVMPKFEHVRMIGATLSQPASLGGAQVPVQAVILPPGISVYDGLEQIPLRCGTHCFDLRGEADAMTAAGPHTVREYRMPDLIIQDQAGTVMFNTPKGVEIYSRDHPMSRLGLNADDYSFSYETFGGSVRTYEGECPKARDPLNPDPPPSSPPGPTTTILVGTAGMSLPNAESESGAQISVSFTLCEDSLREMSFSFSTGDQTAIPMGNSGLFMNFVGGTISLSPGQPSGHTTVVLEVQLRGMSAQADSSTVFIKGVVTIDSRGLFDMQLQAGVKVFANIGVGASGHFWVAWAPLDLGFEVQACVPYDNGFDPGEWPQNGKRCAGNELLFGSLRAHLWQGQGWQNQYHWLPDNDDLHIAARYEVSINIAAGLLVDWAFIVIPPEDIQLFAIKLAFGEFCMNDACTAYEWGVMGAYTLLGYDFGMYYGFDSGLDFIIGSADYLLIDEAGQFYSSAGHTLARFKPQASSTYSVTIPVGAPSAMFILGWDADGGSTMTLTLREPPPGNRTIDENTVAPDVTVTTTPTVRGNQIIIVIDQPLPGDWTIDITGGGTLPDYNFVYFVNNPKPSLSLSGIPEPSDRSLKPGETVEIEWTSNISDAHNAWLSLYYSVTNPITSSEVIVGPIVERLPLKAQGTYEWEVQGLAMIDDYYHVFARIDSNVAAAVNDCGVDHEYNPDPTANINGCGTMLNSSLVLPEAEILNLAEFTYEDWDPPNSPILVGAQPVNWSSVMVKWRPNSEVDLAGYLVQCTQNSLIRTVRTSAVHTSEDLLQESAQVNGLIPNQNATCSLRAYDTSGNVSGSSDSTIVLPAGEALIEPESGGTLISPNGKVTVEFPPGAVESSTYVTYTQRTLPLYPIESLQFAGTSFDISAFVPIRAPVIQFKSDFTITVTYDDHDWQDEGIGEETLLNLYWWDGGSWQGLLPCDGCSHDTVSNRVTVLFDHVNEFALMAGQMPPTSDLQLYLPLIVKTE